MAFNLLHTAILTLILESAVTAFLIPDPCQQHAVLDEPRRRVTAVHHTSDPLGTLCDRYLRNGWYTFANGKIPNHCIQYNHCSTFAPIWLNGTNPDEFDGEVQRYACVNEPSNDPQAHCCALQLPVRVKNCSSYLVYKLDRTPGCDMAYCVEILP